MSDNKSFLIAGFFLLFCSVSYSQTLTNSPYSRYGIGDIIEGSISQSQAMGGVDQAQRYSSWINYVSTSSSWFIKIVGF